MPKRQIFYSFHYANDVMRVQQIRNIGALEDNKPVAPNVWEEVRRRGDAGIKRWIDDNMAYRSCVVVLVGGRPPIGHGSSMRFGKPGRMARDSWEFTYTT